MLVLAMFFDVFWHRFCLPLWHPFVINVVVLGWSFLIWFVGCVFHVFFNFTTQNGAHELGRGFQGVRPIHKITFWRRHRFKDVFSLIWHRFWIDLAMILEVSPLGVRCLFFFAIQLITFQYNCAMAKPRLAALKIIWDVIFLTFWSFYDFESSESTQKHFCICWKHPYNREMLQDDVWKLWKSLLFIIFLLFEMSYL